MKPIKRETCANVSFNTEQLVNDAKEIRISKLLASWGLASRRKIEEWIALGRISVNGRIVTEQGTKANPLCDIIELDGRRLSAPSAVDKKLYIALYKPLGVVSTMSDELGRKALPSLLPADVRRLFPVGRLDADSSGLLIMTDDGELTNRLLHPKYKVEKEYLVKIEGLPLNRDEVGNFISGVDLEDGHTAPCSLSFANGLYKIILKEGKKRQIRRMFDFFGRKVVMLRRIGFGPIKLGELKPGEYRELSQNEIEALRAAAGLR